MNNGDGLRVVLWLSGCSHHCYNCQNPQTWNPDNGIPFDEDAKQEIFEELSKDYISGITLSGGDPLYQENVSQVLSLIKEIKEKFPDKTIWLYTGYTYEQIMWPVITDDFNPERDKLISEKRKILRLCDVLVDGEYIDEQRDITLKWKGSANQRVIDVQKSIKDKKVQLYER
jgi:anaerobic ribonucleoside-triphosphate reductase activating protein